MRLVRRDLEPADIELQFARLCGTRAYHCYDPDLLAHVPGVLRAMVEAGSAMGDVIEDRNRPPESRAVGLGIGVFVTTSFLKEAESTLPPYVRAQLVERVLQGRSPVLNPRQIRHEDGSLNLFIIEDMLANRTLSDEELRDARNKGFEAGLARFRCFRLCSWTSEFYGAALRPMFEASGARVRRDYGEWADRLQTTPEESERPVLVGLTRDECAACDGTPLSMLFAHTPRRLLFHPAERDMLRRAMEGATDEDLATSLCLSLSAVKKRWTAVYSRVEQADAGLLPAAPNVVSEHRARGREMRRHLLNYLREHPEELQMLLA